MRPARRRTLRRQQRAERGSRTAPLTGREIRGDVDGVIPIYRRMSGRQVAEGRFRRRNRGEHAILLHRSERFGSGVPSTPTGQSQLWKLHFVNRGVQLWRAGDGTDVGRSPESGPVSRSVPVLVLCCRPGRSPGPGRLTPKMGAGNHPGQDAKTAPHRLSLLGRVAIPAVVGQLVDGLRANSFTSLRSAATHRTAALATECAQSQRGIRPLIALRRDAGRYRALFFSAPTAQYWGCTGV